MRELARFLRNNPQAAILLAICLVLGLGTLIAIMISAASSGQNPSTPGGDAGLLLPLHIVLGR